MRKKGLPGKLEGEDYSVGAAEHIHELHNIRMLAMLKKHHL